MLNVLFSAETSFTSMERSVASSARYIIFIIKFLTRFIMHHPNVNVLLLNYTEMNADLINNTIS